MSDEVKIKKLRLEVLEEHAILFKSLQKALGHDEPEQTFATMINLLQAAVLLTSKDQPKVYLYTRDADKVAKRVVTCPRCNLNFRPPVSLESDGFREMAVDLG